MKAIKLASVFAVSAVAAAVSTTTFAAEPVFSGTAGLVYTSAEADGGDSWGSKGEVNIIADTGVVYFDLDMKDGAFVLDEAYVKQGAVSFGDFDGTLVDSAVMYGGVEEGNDFSTDFGITLGARYDVMPGLTVALEAVEGSAGTFGAFSYTADLGAAELTLSGGASVGTDKSNQAVAVGVSVPAGDMVTVQAYYQTGEEADADIGSMGAGIDVAVSDELSISAAMYTDQEYTAKKKAAGKDEDITEVSAYYTAGDLTYYATFLSGDADKGSNDYSLVGVKASF
ncbi:hypothetical protein [Marinomonas balearica]|uniref:Porin n=1 Tax=Marinomonas balearica TaxID=491947 RepID=A0A4R6MCU9_9GAMM|nr:hypothetical protein [Marinomonas balearica]TDO99491.1 hypothetical protein DFP79_0474 [Marinomonas balearica]